jgi:hypothetical protein
MIFWLFSGWVQKSGAAICSSSFFSLAFCAAASKIPPHGERLFAEGRVFSFQFLYSHGSIQF